MKYLLITILILTTIIHSAGQDIESISFTTQQVDEPPTKQGRPLYTIDFILRSNNELIATNYLIDSDRQKLKDTIKIDKERIGKLIAWKESNRKTYTLTDLGIEFGMLANLSSNHELNFEIPHDLIVNVDSFQFCQKYKLLKTITIGGEIIAVTLIFKSGLKQEFAFDSNDLETGQQLRDYIYCYTILRDKIPGVVRNSDFFSSGKMADILLHYQKTVECEGYYYKEYADKQPKMSNREKRQRTGWNFVEYIKQRGNK